MVHAGKEQRKEIIKFSHINAENYLKIVCDYLSEKNPKFNWTGVYILNGSRLNLAAYHGEATEHVSIRLGEGLCSLAINEDRVVNESDVKGNGKYLACFINTNSELVVPVRFNGKAIGEIDIDSDTKGAFSEEDEQFIEFVAELIAPVVSMLYVKD